MARTPKSKPLSNSINDTKRKLHDVLPPREYTWADRILKDGKTEKAIALLDKAWGGKYPRVAEVIKIVVQATIPPDASLAMKETQLKFAKAAKDLLNAVDRGVYTLQIGSGRLRPVDGGGEPIGVGYDPSDITDEAAINALRLVHEVFMRAGSTPRRGGRPEDFRKRFMCSVLDNIFRGDFGRPHHGIITLLWGAGEGKNKSPKVVGKLVAKYKRQPYPKWYKAILEGEQNPS
jgi:hypothetical protein